jgi:transglutaminase-like putative cysteine protease
MAKWGVVISESQATADRSEGSPSKFARGLNFLLEKAPQQWVSLLLMTLTLGIAVRCIEQSHWIAPQPSLLLVLVLGVLSSTLLLKSRLHVAFATLTMVLLGIAVILWQLLGLLSSVDGSSATSSLWAGLKLLAVNLGQTNIAVATIFLVFIWVMACLSTWFLLRKRNAWVAVSLGTLAILLNLRYITDDFYPYFFFYLFAAIFLIGQVNIPVLTGTKMQSSFPHSRHTVVGSIVALIIVTTVFTVGAWMVPAFRFNGVQTFIATKMDWSGKVINSGINVFTTVSAKQTMVTNAERDTLVLGGNDQSGQTVQFVVTSPVHPAYWQVRLYDVYFPWGWSNSPVTKQPLDSTVKVKIPATVGKYGTFTYKVVGKVRTDLVLTGGEFVSADVPVNVQSVSPGDIVGVSTQRLMDYGESYSSTSRVNLATPADLGQAGINYPNDISNRYLQLPSTLPLRVRQLARRLIMSVSQTPYQKVQLIQDYVHQVSYVEAGTAPPRGADGVDYFLFDAKKGNCSNFASAMAVMLRSVGVPSRVATGYLPRDWNESSGTFILHARDYHAWVQVYFPGYGWVDFEATPATGGDNTVVTATTVIGGSSANIEPDIPQDGSSDPGIVNLPPVGSNGSGLGGLWLKIFLVAGSLALLVFGVVLAWKKLTSRFHRGDYAADVYYKMCLLGSVLRLGPHPSETPEEYCDRLADAFPLQTESIGYISQTFQEKRFGRSNEVGWRDRQNLRYSWQMLSHAMLKRLFGLERRRPFHEVLVLGMGQPRR